MENMQYTCDLYKYDGAGNLQEKTLTCEGTKEEYEQINSSEHFRMPKSLAALLSEYFREGWKWYETYECVGHGIFVGV